MEKDLKEQLAAPFTITAPDGKMHPSHKWRVQSYTKDKAVCIPYIDARQVSERLNDVLGIEGWSNTLIEVTGESIINELTIEIEGKSMTRSDVGTPANVEKEKSRASDSLKRAAVHFGVGRYLYNIEPVTLPKVAFNGKPYPGTSDNKALTTGDTLTSYINMMDPLRMKLTEIYNSLTKEQQTSVQSNFTAIWETLTK